MDAGAGFGLPDAGVGVGVGPHLLDLLDFFFDFAFELFESFELLFLQLVPRLKKLG